MRPRLIDSAVARVVVSIPYRYYRLDSAVARVVTSIPYRYYRRRRRLVVVYPSGDTSRLSVAAIPYRYYRRRRRRLVVTPVLLKLVVAVVDAASVVLLRIP